MLYCHVLNHTRYHNSTLTYFSLILFHLNSWVHLSTRATLHQPPKVTNIVIAWRQATSRQAVHHFLDKFQIWSCTLHKFLITNNSYESINFPLNSLPIHKISLNFAYVIYSNTQNSKCSSPNMHIYHFHQFPSHHTTTSP